MEGMSEREYSAHSGLSRWAIQKARQTARLVVYSDGSINASASDARRGEMTDPDQQRRSTGGDTGFCGPADGSSYLKASELIHIQWLEQRRTVAAAGCHSGMQGKMLSDDDQPGPLPGHPEVLPGLHSLLV
jgi:hypothetical protein